MGPQRRLFKVLIVGGGMSGLTCARELQARGYEVLVVEGRGRPGGRLKTAEVGGCKVDMGGMFVHGIRDNPVAILASGIGLGVRGMESTVLYDHDGKRVSKEDDVAAEKAWNDDLELAHSVGRCEDGELMDHETMDMDFMAIMNMGTKKGELGEAQERVYNWHRSNLELSCGSDLSKVGRGWNEDEPYGFAGDHVLVKGGYEGIINKLAEGVDIVYECDVKEICMWQGDVGTDGDEEENTPDDPNPNSGDNPSGRIPGERARKSRFPSAKYGKFKEGRSMEDYPGGVTVVTSKGEFDADMVVCTASLGVLKSGRMKFNPPLPRKKIAAIKSMGMGNLNKCALSFPSCFWDDVDFVGHCPLAPGSYFLFTNMVGAEGKPTLCAMFGGDFADSVESMTDDEVVSGCMEALRTIYPGAPDPTDRYVSRWRSDQYAGGSFCYVPPGVNAEIHHDSLSEPLSDKNGILRVMFAGEATTKFHPSTVHGAYLTGIREAYRIDLTYDPDGGDGTKFNWSGDTMYKRTFRIKKSQTEDGEKYAARASDNDTTNATALKRDYTPFRERRKRVSVDVIIPATEPITTLAASKSPSPYSGSCRVRKKSRRLLQSTGEIEDDFSTPPPLAPDQSASTPAKVEKPWTKEEDRDVLQAYDIFAGRTDWAMLARERKGLSSRTATEIRNRCERLRHCNVWTRRRPPSQFTNRVSGNVVCKAAFDGGRKTGVVIVADRGNGTALVKMDAKYGGGIEIVNCSDVRAFLG